MGYMHISYLIVIWGGDRQTDQKNNFAQILENNTDNLEEILNRRMEKLWAQLPQL